MALDVKKMAQKAAKMYMARLKGTGSLLGDDVHEAFLALAVMQLMAAQDESLHHKPIGPWIAVMDEARRFLGTDHPANRNRT